MSKELLKTLLDYTIYEKHQHKLKESLFPEKLIRSLYRTLIESHKRNKTDLSLEDLKTLHYTYNPALTQSAKRSLDSVFAELAKVNVSGIVAEDTLNRAIQTSIYNEVAALCIDAADGKSIDLSEIRALLDSTQTLTTEEFPEVTWDIDEMLAEDALHYKYTYHHNGLQEVLGGIGPGVFQLLGGRPNSGKTAYVVSNIYHPKGWAAQKAHVHIICNEEKAVRTQLRGVSCYTGIPKLEILHDPAKKKTAKELCADIKPYVHTHDEFGMTLERLDKLIQQQLDKDTMGILMLDQIDKIQMKGSFDADHLRLRQLYTNVREMTKKYDIPIIGISQTSEGAEGKLYYGMEFFEGSKTGKAAEVDQAITIGKEAYSTNQGVDTGFRVANVPKNKLTGKEISVPFMLEPALSRISE